MAISCQALGTFLSQLIRGKDDINSICRSQSVMDRPEFGAAQAMSGAGKLPAAMPLSYIMTLCAFYHFYS
jgi:hypothetical protein